MNSIRFDRSVQNLARLTGRRDAVRSLGEIGTALLAALGLAGAASADKPNRNGRIGGGHNRQKRGKDDHRTRNGARGNAGEEMPQSTGRDVPAVSAGTAQRPLAQNGTVHADRKKKRKCSKGCSTRPGRPPVVRFGTSNRGPAFVSSTALCNPGEYAVGGGFNMFSEAPVAVNLLVDAPLEDDDGVPIGWTASIHNDDVFKMIQAQVLCVAD
jgi:hypothetical protein